MFESASPWPDNVLVMGGGRWARVYIETMLGLLPASSRIRVYSPRNSNAMTAWIAGKGIQDRVCASSELPVLPTVDSWVAIVVNAAADHEKSIDWALSGNIPVLVEKPFTSSAAAADRLIAAARRRGVYLAAAHVFLFADYLCNFASCVRLLKRVDQVDVLWADAAAEARYGEAKSFDPSLRIFEDCLPHVLSLLQNLWPDDAFLLDRLELARGGAQLELVLNGGGRQCRVRLIRGATSRQRSIAVVGLDERLMLDFAKEPGVIMRSTGQTSAAPDWATSSRPLSKMLTAFLTAASGGHRDARLDAGLGRRAAVLSDQVLLAYLSAQGDWLAKTLPESRENDEDLRYALRELALTSGLSGPVQEYDSREAWLRLIQDIRDRMQTAAGRELLGAQALGFVKSALKKNRMDERA